MPLLENCQYKDFLLVAEDQVYHGDRTSTRWLTWYVFPRAQRHVMFGDTEYILCTRHPKDDGALNGRDAEHVAPTVLRCHFGYLFGDWFGRDI